VDFPEWILDFHSWVMICRLPASGNGVQFTEEDIQFHGAEGII